MTVLQRGASFLFTEMRMCSARQDGFDAGPEHLNCMEVRGGHAQADYFFSRPGLDVWVASRPQRNTTQEGGEVHFFSSCASGRITRMLLADVGGLGTHFNDVARELRDMMKQSVNAISEKTVMRRLSGNLKFAAQHHGFASIVMGTFFCADAFDADLQCGAPTAIAVPQVERPMVGSEITSGPIRCMGIPWRDSQPCRVPELSPENANRGHVILLQQRTDRVS